VQPPAVHACRRLLLLLLLLLKLLPLTPGRPLLQLPLAQSPGQHVRVQLLLV
jgi:hypothetical protein